MKPLTKIYWSRELIRRVSLGFFDVKVTKLSSFRLAIQVVGFDNLVRNADLRVISDCKVSYFIEDIAVYQSL